MKVVLLENVKKLGKVGDVVNVSDGYAANFLFPRKLAQVATPDILKRVEQIKVNKAKSEKEEMNKLTELSRSIKDEKIVISAKAKGEKLFGSIDAGAIAKEIKNQLGIEIGRENIKLESPIKEIGEKKINIEFLKNIKTNIIVEVREEK
ncbi:MAG: 50S ribosomal protein L9 [Candidatus Moranbacteria bacterium GW2011_GWF1_34_10]|nr:MAG: 50S ribosomal protein L9 [Candidatus Moranbacteria bacterium GW2011_GWF1_34_10]